MIDKRICTVLLIACATLFPLAATADDPKAKVIPNKYADAVSNPGLEASIEGGITDVAKAGRYYAGHNTQFKSGYAKVPLATAATFAYDLDGFNTQKGCGWVRYKDELKKNSDKKQALSKTYMSYDKQKEFAQTWWSKHDPSFAKDKAQDVWLYESVLDATYLFDKYRQKSGDNNKEYMDSVLDKLTNKK